MDPEPPTKPFINPARAGASGILGAFLFTATLVFLTIVEYDFMLSIGWNPLSDPGGAWPSGHALGPYGWMMNVSFVISGVFLMVFAIGLQRAIRSKPAIGATLIFVSGAAMTFMAFETDPILREGPRSFHGWVHDISFAGFAMSLLASMFFLWREFNKDPAWKPHARYTLATGIVAAVCLLLPGVAYYVFIIVLLVWIFVTAVALRRGEYP